MATITENGLFPAIIDSFIPAVPVLELTNNRFNIPFNISYNDREDIESVHISITRQSNYHSALDRGNYPRGVYVVNTPAGGSTDPNMSVNIPLSILQTDELSFNEYYKIQVRLSEDTYIPPDPEESSNPGEYLSEYLTNEDNLPYFSEWSTVCLVRFINTPEINLKINGEDPTQSEFTLNNSNLTIAGTYTTTVRENPPFHNQPDNEFLNKYKVIVQQENLQEELETIFESDYLIVNLNNLNEFNYTIPYYFDNGNYSITFQYETANLYEGQSSYNVTISHSSSSWAEQSIVQEMTSVNNVLGKINISFFPFDENTTIPAGAQFVVRRGNDGDNFTIWDEVYNYTLPAAITGQDSISFDDYTVESGVLYKYEINYVDHTTSTPVYYSIVEGPAMTIFDHAFLTGEGTQLCVKFNPNIGGFQINVGDGKVTPVGSQYPYINRNGDMYYRSFSLSGTIAYEMDEQHMFASRSSIYGDWIQVYGSYFVNHYMNQQNDRVTQRKFREIVTRYLYDDVPKLFRSTPEGNILVRLTDITLTPNTQLGRMIYDFSCTATEIGEPSIENCKLYKVQDFGD